MPKIIKLENINLIYRVGERAVEEYVCENCRHLVNPGDEVCWQCGETLEQSSLVEHYHKGEQLTDKEYKKRLGGK